MSQIPYSQYGPPQPALQYGSPQPVLQYGSPQPVLQYGSPQPVMQLQQNVPQNNLPKIGLGSIIFIILLGLVIWLVAFRKNGKFSEWSKYTECSAPCGGGTETRTRTYEPAKYGGKDLPDKDKLKETQKCNEAPCKINGKMSDWKDTNGACQISETNIIPITCGTGKKQQTRSYIAALNGGTDLDVNNSERLKLSQWTTCELGPCPNPDGSFTDWKYTGNCVSDQVALTPKTCGDGGTQKQTRTYIPPKGTGKDLPDKETLFKWDTCENVLPPCPARTDGSCTAWIDDGVCNCSSTGINQKKQTRIYIAPANGGNPAPAGCDSTVTRNVACPEPCPKDPILVEFVPQPTDKCLPQTGRSRERSTIGKYTFPVGKPHSQFITINFSPAQLETIKKLEYGKPQIFKGTLEGDVTFTRINNTIPEEYNISKSIKCDNIEIFSESKINDIWQKQIGCTGNFNNDNIFLSIDSNLENLKYMETGADIINKFSKFSKSNLLLTPNYANTKLCYPDNYLTFTLKDNYVASDKFLPGFIASNVDGGIWILSNNGFKLAFQGDGNLVLQTDTAIYWASDTPGQNIKLLTMQNDGNLTMKNLIGQQWATDTYNTPGAYLHLTSWGDLNIVNPTNNNITRTIYKNIKYYLENTFYNNSPNAVFSDKKGRFFKFKWSDYENGRVIDQIGSETGANNYIRGKYMNVDNSEWDVNELNLVNISGYDSPITGRNDNKPNKGDDRNVNDGDNYNEEQDRKNFYSDSGDKTGMILGPKIRKPPQLSGGGSKPNYLPGYIRRSIVDCNEEACSHKFLVMNRSGRNQAFVVYQKYHDRATFANDIMVNHPDLLAKIKKDFNTMQR
jgi:hypothetical protein